jgi:hypothetical protein
MCRRGTFTHARPSFYHSPPLRIPPTASASVAASATVGAAAAATRRLCRRRLHRRRLRRCHDCRFRSYCCCFLVDCCLPPLLPLFPSAAAVRRSCLPPPLPPLLSGGAIANVTATPTAAPVPSAVSLPPLPIFLPPSTLPLCFNVSDCLYVSTFLPPRPPLPLFLSPSPP